MICGFGKFQKILLAGSLLFFVATTSSIADGWRSLYDQGVAAYHEDRYADGIALLTKAANLAASYNDERLGNSLSKLADCYYQQSQYNTAEPLYRQTAAIFNRVSGSQSNDYASSLYDLGLCLYKNDKDKEAISVLNKAAAIQSTNLGNDSSDYADTLLALGKALDAADKDEEAESKLRQAIEIYASTSGSQSLDMAHAQNALASVLRDEGEYEETESLLKSSIIIKERLEGAFDADTAVGLCNLAGLYCALENYKAAEPLYRRAILIDTKVYGVESMDVAGDIASLADCLMCAARYEEAEPYFKQALAIYQKIAAKDDTDYLSCLDGQAKLFRCTKRVAEAEKLEALSDALLTAADRENVKEFLNKPFTDKWAVCIGISEFKDKSNNLSWPAKDASDTAEHLIQFEHFPATHVRLLQNSQATKKNILNVIGSQWLPVNAKEDDLVVIFISSHGSSASSTSSGFNFLLPYDSTDDLSTSGIPMQELMRMIKNNIRANRVIIVLDACHSGATTKSEVKRQGNFDARSLAHDAGQVILCSSEVDETSADSSKLENGAFTHYFLEGLRLRGDQTTLGEAFRYAQKRVIEYSDSDDDKQTPVMKGLWDADNLRLASP
ncbi:MAG: tetratricopeptide repeat protein [Candidatus Obscuribacterales bacterium]|nr:tetratricopeptide repeat protein [Candidatus Obscuribacterales bacterium]